MDISEFLRIPYLDFGRTTEGADCYGLLRIVRHALTGELLPAHGAISPADKPALTRAAHDVLDVAYREVDLPRPGSIVTCWRGALCLHVGVVIEAEGRLAVLDTGSKCGVRWFRLADFERKFRGVKYFDNRQD